MDRYICIHAHFYQPPRENAWLEFVELQDSAYCFMVSLCGKRSSGCPKSLSRWARIHL